MNIILESLSNFSVRLYLCTRLCRNIETNHRIHHIILPYSIHFHIALENGIKRRKKRSTEWSKENQFPPLRLAYIQYHSNIIGIVLVWYLFELHNISDGINIYTDSCIHICNEDDMGEENKKIVELLWLFYYIP